MGVRFGDIKLQCGLSIALHASPPGVAAEKLPSADVFGMRYSFCLSWSQLSPGCASAMPLLRRSKVSNSGRVELPLALSTRDVIKWQRRECAWRGGSPQRHYRLSHAI